MLSESVTLLGGDLYNTIPKIININAIPTASELEYVGAEDFDKTMVTSIFPKVIDDSKDMDFMELLEIDYDWICRCLRMKSYGPFFTTNRIYCPSCNNVYKGDYNVDLRNVPVTPLPDKFVNAIRIESDNFIDDSHEFTIKLLTIQDRLHIEQDNMFMRPDGTKNTTLANICYMIKRIGQEQNVTPVEVRSYILNKMSSADYEILKSIVSEKTNFGVHVMGNVECPKCHSKDAYFIALRQDKFFRPSLGDIKQYKSAVRSGEWKNLPGNPADYVRIDS